MSCQQLVDECKLGIFCWPGSEVVWQIRLSLSPPPYSVKCWQKWKGLGKVIYTLTHWTAMLLYQLQIYKVQVTYSSQIVGIVYPIRIYISKNVHSPTLCPKGTQKPFNLHSSSKCWHDISNINIYLQVTYTPQIVGIIYPIQIHISKNPKPIPKGHTETLQLTFILQVLA